MFERVHRVRSAFGGWSSGGQRAVPLSWRRAFGRFGPAVSQRKEHSSFRERERERGDERGEAERLMKVKNWWVSSRTPPSRLMACFLLAADRAQQISGKQCSQFVVAIRLLNARDGAPHVANDSEFTAVGEACLTP